MTNKVEVPEVQTLLNKNHYAQSIKSVLNKNPEAICRISGTAQDLSLHHIVPRWIILYAPQKHQAFQTVVLSRGIHDEYELLADSYREWLCKRAGVPYKTQAKFLPVDSKLRTAQRYSRILLDHAYETDLKLLEEANHFLRVYLNVDFINRSELRELTRIPNKLKNPKYINYGKVLIDYFGIEKLERFWTNHYLKFEKKQRQIYNFEKSE